MRKYVDIAGREGGNHLFVVDQDSTEYVDPSDVELTYYRDLVDDVRNRTETAVPQEHTFETMRLAAGRPAERHRPRRRPVVAAARWEAARGLFQVLQRVTVALAAVDDQPFRRT